MSKAMEMKEAGNRQFQSGDYAGAEALYSKAIILDPKNHTLYTNRAFARLRLGSWDSVIADCDASLSLTPDGMKAYYYLSQAKLAIRDYDSALTTAVKAHGLCVASGDKSLSAVTAQVLRCKKERWEHMERIRNREGASLENEVVGLLQKARDETLAVTTDESERRDVEREWAEKEHLLDQLFERARSPGDKKRRVPDWAIDDISFSVMVDPVITKSGRSYERETIMSHLRRHQNDPLTREPLQPEELRANLGLRDACAEFLDENGWAVDW